MKTKPTKTSMAVHRGEIIKKGDFWPAKNRKIMAKEFLIGHTYQGTRFDGEPLRRPIAPKPPRPVVGKAFKPVKGYCLLSPSSPNSMIIFKHRRHCPQWLKEGESIIPVMVCRTHPSQKPKRR